MGVSMKQSGGKLRVLMVNTVPMQYEGITMVMLNYARNMDRGALQLDFAAFNDVPPALRQEIAQMGSKLHVIENRNRRPLRYLVRLARLIRREGYDVVHAHGNSCTLAVEMLAARLGGAKVRCAHSHNTRCSSTRVNNLLRPAFMGNYTHAFACGDAAGRWLFGDRPFTVLNNGVDTARFAFRGDCRAEYRCALGVEGKTAIGHVANFNDQKNHFFLIDAFARAAEANPGLALVLVGDGKNRAEIEKKARDLNLQDRVIFTGTRRDVPQILSAMDFMVLPSLYEGLPNVMIEWQASGLHALVADTVTQEAKLTPLVEFLPLDLAAWAKRMAEMAVDPADRERDSAAAIERIREKGYDIRANAERLAGLYREYVNGKR